MPKVWRKLRLVIEVPVQGDLSERDLRWAIDQIIGGNQIRDALNRYRVRPVFMGRTLIKEYSKVRAYEKRKKNDAHQE